MDNASKALIMAGAILISIAIVGVGVYIFSTTSDIGSSTSRTFDAYAATQSNSQLTQYEGNKIKGSTVKDFMNLVNTFNKNDVFPVDIELAGSAVKKSGSGDYSLATGVSNTTFCTIELSDNNSDSYIDYGKITKNN